MSKIHPFPGNPCLARSYWSDNNLGTWWANTMFAMITMLITIVVAN